MILILFDIDGTILNTDGAGTRAAERAFEKMHGIKGAMHKIDMAGKTDPLILREIYINELSRSYTAEEAEEIYGHYIGFLEEEVGDSAVDVLPGIPALLERLSAREDIVLGVATGNIEDGAWIKLGKPGLRRFFRFGGFGSDSEHREDLIRAAIARAAAFTGNGGSFRKIFVIGDTPHDINHGRAAGAITVAVATGRYKSHELAEHKPDYLFEDLSDLETIMALFV